MNAVVAERQNGGHGRKFERRKKVGMYGTRGIAGQWGGGGWCDGGQTKQPLTMA